MKECKKYKIYKGINKPKCNKGKGCKACNRKYELRQLATERYKSADLIQAHPSSQVREIVLEHRRTKFIENVEYYLDHVDE